MDKRNESEYSIQCIVTSGVELARIKVVPVATSRIVIERNLVPHLPHVRRTLLLPGFYSALSSSLKMIILYNNSTL